ncbi:MAG: hydantoinase/oxoprolinase family protein, partial [Gammaproteobacteria bacterium]|nr:hydantoinase/oxoprolinase family protein [Gammaproteobacteria bacterium]
GHEIAVNLPVEKYDAGHAAVFQQAFEAAYTQLYGRTIDGIDVEALSWTLTISAPAPAAPAAPPAVSASRSPEPVGRQSCFDPAMAGRTDAHVFLRDQLAPGDRISGPALITEDQTTTVVTSSYDATIDARGYIVLTRRGDDDE